MEFELEFLFQPGLKFAFELEFKFEFDFGFKLEFPFAVAFELEFEFASSSTPLPAFLSSVQETTATYEKTLAEPNVHLSFLRNLYFREPKMVSK